MKILTIEWVENEAECKYVAPIDEGVEEKIRGWKFNISNDFSVLVLRNHNCTNYFSVQTKSCTLVKIGDDVLLDTSIPKVKLPPIGVKPRYLHDEARMADLEGVIERYLGAGANPKKEWLEELEELKRRYGEDRPDIAYHWNTVIDTGRCGQ